MPARELQAAFGVLKQTATMQAEVSTSKNISRKERRAQARGIRGGLTSAFSACTWAHLCFLSMHGQVDSTMQVAYNLALAPAVQALPHHACQCVNSKSQGHVFCQSIQDPCGVQVSSYTASQSLHTD